MFHQARNKTHPIPMPFPNMEPRPKMQSPRTNPPSLIKRTQTYSGCNGDTFVLRMCCRQYNFDSTQLPHNRTSKTNAKMMEKVKQLLDYCASQEEAIITYNKSKMILVVHSDAGYCNKKKSRSQAGGHFSYWMKTNSPPTTVQYLLRRQ
jgi:hypothetical protein